jgi:hypothetical protein
MSPTRNQPGSRTEVSPGARARPSLQRAHAPPSNTALTTQPTTSKRASADTRRRAYAHSWFAPGASASSIASA